MNSKVVEATSEDIPYIASSILRAIQTDSSAGLLKHTLCHLNEQDILKTVTSLLSTKSKHYAHVSNFLIAKHDKSNIGLICAYEPRVATISKLQEGLDEIGSSVNAEQSAALFLKMLPDSDRKTWILDFAYVDSEFEKMTIFSDLVKKALLKARLKGYRKAQTIIDIESVEVALLYKKLGFEVSCECIDELYEQEFKRAGVVVLNSTL